VNNLADNSVLSAFSVIKSSYEM